MSAVLFDHSKGLCGISTWTINSILWPQIRQDYPLNLSILISGGKETNKDSLSNGEWSGNSSNLKSLGATSANCSLEKRLLWPGTVQVLWNETSERVRIPYLAVSPWLLYGAFSTSQGCQWWRMWFKNTSWLSATNTPHLHTNTPHLHTKTPHLHTKCDLRVPADCQPQGQTILGAQPPLAGP